ncbi:MAG TPA: SpoVA/SpoVAEb family sporulation membrane protein [Syntrophomonas sp.]|nr:SpoVA/SpoVAEb family sporulation membrane protein [Syntrophomonas sp.]
MGKRILGAFLVGGCVGVVGQAVISLLDNVIPDPMLVIILAMFLVAVISFILIITDVYPKISKVGYFGADLPVCGLMYGAASATAMTRKSGAPAGAAFLKGFGMVGTIVFGGYAICMLIGVAAFFIGK